MVVTFELQKNGIKRKAARRTGRMHPTKSKFIMTIP
jgi:hypothetical protein